MNIYSHNAITFEDTTSEIHVHPFVSDEVYFKRNNVNAFITKEKMT